MKRKTVPWAWLGLAVYALAACCAAPGAETGPASKASLPDNPSLPQATLNLRLTAPINSWDEAIPLGNGLMGGLLWGDKNVVRLSLDRGDLWDERPYAEREWWKNRNWKKGGDWDGPYNGVTPTKLPAGRLEITLDPSQSLSSFELNLATAEGRAQFAGGARLEAFFSAAEPVALIRIPGPEPKAFDLIPSGARKPGGDAGPSSGGAVSALGYPPAVPGHDGRAQWYVQEAAEGLKYCACVETKRLGGQTLAAVAVTSTKDAAEVLALARERCSAALAQTYEAMLQAARGVVAAVLGPLGAASAGARPRAVLLSRALFLRRGLAARRPTHAPAGRLDRRQRRAAAMEGRLSQRPQHADDLYRLSGGGDISTKALAFSTTFSSCCRCSGSLPGTSTKHPAPRFPV